MDGAAEVICELSLAYTARLASEPLVPRSDCLFKIEQTCATRVSQDAVDLWRSPLPEEKRTSRELMDQRLNECPRAELVFALRFSLPPGFSSVQTAAVGLTP